MVTVFWNEKGLLLLEFMPQKTTITGQNYANTITTLQEAIKEKRRGKLSAGMLLLHETAPAHACKISSYHLAMWFPAAKSPTLQSTPSYLGLFSIQSYQQISSG